MEYAVRELYDDTRGNATLGSIKVPNEGYKLSPLVIAKASLKYHFSYTYI